ncbi:MAG: threo-3-hydroxy-L-aspartate ammonia-lyase [Planctomycetota bacterium]|jgi:threonine dehydratase
MTTDIAIPTFGDVEAAAARIEDVANRTPVMTSRTLDERVGASVFCKCENYQRVGAFKFRGAYNAVSRLSDEQKKNGVLAFSSGNHAQGIALACQLLGVHATIVMPSDAPRVKRQATEGYGAEVIEYVTSETQREELGRELAAERGLTIVPPFDHEHIIAGQGTVAYELHNEVPDLDVLMVCVGGGGVISGCAIATKHMRPECRVIGVEPEAGDDVKRSLESGEIVTIEVPDTIADGARTPCPGPVTLACITKHVDAIETTSDASLVRTMRFYYERMKLVVEPTGCLSLAPLLEGAIDVRGLRVGVVITGGNVDPDLFCRLVSS